MARKLPLAGKGSLKNNQNSNFLFQGRKNVRLFGVMTKTPVLSEKKRTFKVVNTH